MKNNKIEKKNFYTKTKEAFKKIGLIANIIIFAGVTVLNYFLFPCVTNGWTFLIIGWFIMCFVILGAIGGLGTFIGSLFTKSKIKIIYILLSLAILGANSYFFYQILQVID